jgi:hypothetical protein
MHTGRRDSVRDCNHPWHFPARAQGAQPCFAATFFLAQRESDYSRPHLTADRHTPKKTIHSRPELPLHRLCFGKLGSFTTLSGSYRAKLHVFSTPPPPIGLLLSLRRPLRDPLTPSPLTPHSTPTCPSILTALSVRVFPSQEANMETLGGSRKDIKGASGKVLRGADIIFVGQKLEVPRLVAPSLFNPTLTLTTPIHPAHSRMGSHMHVQAYWHTSVSA